MHQNLVKLDSKGFYYFALNAVGIAKPYKISKNVSNVRQNSSRDASWSQDSKTAFKFEFGGHTVLKRVLPRVLRGVSRGWGLVGGALRFCRPHCHLCLPKCQAVSSLKRSPLLGSSD